MSKDGTYRGGRRVRAGDKPDSLSNKIASGRSARVFEPIDLEDEPSFEMDSSDFLDPVDLEGSQIPKPSEYLSSEQKDGKPLGADKNLHPSRKSKIFYGAREPCCSAIKSSKKRGCGLKSESATSL